MGGDFLPFVEFLPVANQISLSSPGVGDSAPVVRWSHDPSPHVRPDGETGKTGSDGGGGEDGGDGEGVVEGYPLSQQHRGAHRLLQEWRWVHGRHQVSQLLRTLWQQNFHWSKLFI